MADIYIVYASEDRDLTEKLHGFLEQQWDTWWDDKIVGSFGRAIEKEIPKSKCVVALISEHSRDKDAVVSELLLAKRHEIPILLLKLDDAESPYLFNTYSCTEMKNWNGEVDHAGLKQLQRRIVSIIPPRTHPKRPIEIANSRLALPKLFFSASSYNTSIKPSEAVQALRILEAPSILVSAYDLVSPRKPIKKLSDHKKKLSELKKMLYELKKYQNMGGFVLVDSGNYEASRLEDESWGIADFKEALANTPHDFAFCFDDMYPSKGKNKAIDGIIQSVNRDQQFTTSPVLPIVHAPQLQKGGYKLNDLPFIFSEVSKELQPTLIAIPERELGGGIIARAKMVRAIRVELNKLPYYQPIHILGTGHPWAIAILVAAGADSFDGLEWCRYTVNEYRERVSHFHLFDLFGTLDASKMGFAANVAFHNLRYLKEFESIMQSMVADNKIELWVNSIINDTKVSSKLKEQYPEIYQ